MIGPKAYIHSDRLKQNIWNIRRQIGERMLMVVVKADGYGHGALNIASVLAGEPGIIFCVFTIEEAKELREGGISNKILIFSKMQRKWLDQTIEYGLWVNASAMDDLKALREFHNNTGDCPVVHLKFDTGMTRLGFDAGQADTVYQFLAENSNLPVDSLLIENIHLHLSHFNLLFFSMIAYKMRLIISKSNFVKSIVINIAIFSLIVFFNIIFNTNYWFTMSKPPGTNLAILFSDWPYYLFGLIIIGLISYYVTFKLFSKKSFQ